MKKSRDKKSVTCPQCKVVHEIPVEGVDGLSTSFTINNLLELLRIHECSEEAPTESIKCTSGLDDDPQGNPAVARCLTCSDYLCKSCYQVHQKQRLSKNHVIKTLEEIKQSDKTTGARSLHTRQHCPEHEEEVLKLYCKTCKKVICRDCALVTHKEHSYAFIRQVRTDMQKRLVEQISKVHVKEIEFQSYQRYVENLLKISNEAAKSSEMKVNEAMNNLIEAIEVRRAQLLKEIEIVHKSELMSIAAESKSLELSLLRLSDSIRFTQQLIDKGDDVEVTAVGDQTEETLVNLTKLEWDMKKLKPSLLLPEFESLNEHITKFGRILHTVRSSDIIISNVPTKIIPVVGEKCHFEVHLSKDITKRGYIAKLEVTISRLACDATQVDSAASCHFVGDKIPVEVKSNGFNSWNVSFTPTRTGDHQFALQIDGILLASQVFNIVEAHEPDTRLVLEQWEVHSFCLPDLWAHSHRPVCKDDISFSSRKSSHSRKKNECTQFVPGDEYSVVSSFRHMRIGERFLKPQKEKGTLKRK